MLIQDVIEPWSCSPFVVKPWGNMYRFTIDYIPVNERICNNQSLKGAVVVIMNVTEGDPMYTKSLLPESKAEEYIIEDQIQMMLLQDVIEPCNSPLSCSAIVVKNLG